MKLVEIEPDYQIIIGGNIYELMAGVTKKLKEGYQLAGGVAVENRHLLQAVYRAGNILCQD